MPVRDLFKVLVVLHAVWAVGVAAQVVPAAQPVGAAVGTSTQGSAAERSVGEWLQRIHQASQRRSYIGTFVVSSAEGLSSSRIWHVCDGEQQMERVETLTGAPRTTLRRNDDVVTFWPAERVAVAEKRESLGMFPNMLKSSDSAIAQFYEARTMGQDRVAGADADVVLLQARDQLRFSYRIWSERRTGLVVKLQTLDVDGKVLEQAAFSELQMDAPVSTQRLLKMMEKVDGYRVQKPELVKTTALAEGWALKSAVPGFKPMSCMRRALGKDGGAGAESVMQWIFSDGLASVSVFAEAYDRQRHLHEGSASAGSTRSVMRKLVDRQGNRTQEWWLTAVGEVPLQTLVQFIGAMDRQK